VVPDAVLWELPFQALRQPENRYLIEDHALSYAPSLNVLAEINRKRLSQTATSGKQPAEVGLGPDSRTSPLSDLLAFGNPQISAETIEQATSVHRDAKLLPLPEAEREVKSLAQLYGSGSSKVYVGAQAREEKAKEEIRKYRVLHFATHGILDSANPMYSHVVLSRAEGTNEDGLLEAWELVQMNLAAEIVVLSACETARGQIGAGEGVIGLSWAFFVAGCPTTVVSQWQVDSASTTALMIEFHKSLLSGSKHMAEGRARMTKAQALRQAMLTLLKDSRFNNPYFWAGFVVVGDGS
jgi:CHAT domain-containing protein